jgi:HEAT repeats
MKKMIRASLFCSVLMLDLLAVRPMHAVVLPAPPADDDNSAYAVGTRAMNDHRWQDAIASFDKVIDAKDKRADAALYWKAYSLQKIGSNSLAMTTCNQLRSQFPSSTWNNDCGAISIAINVDPQVRVVVPPMPPMPPMEKFKFKGDGSDRGGHATDEDLKILALHSLLNQDPAKAIPLLKGILTNNQSSMNMRRNALFVLAQSKSPEAEAVLKDAVLGKLDPALQSEAVQSIAIYEGKRANDTLVQVYRSTSDAKVKKSVINSIFITKDAQRLVDLARAEKDLDMKRDIVSKLAIMHDQVAQDYMLELLK